MMLHNFLQNNNQYNKQIALENNQYNKQIVQQPSGKNKQILLEENGTITKTPENR